MSLTRRYRGGFACENCGEIIKWVQLRSGMWIAVQTKPVLFIPGEGKRHLVEFCNYDAQYMTDCLIYEKGKEMDTNKVVQGYMPHMFVCPGK